MASLLVETMMHRAFSLIETGRKWRRQHRVLGKRRVTFIGMHKERLPHYAPKNAAAAARS